MIIGIIPARYASTRFPGKPLIEIEGKSMIQRVYEQAAQAKTLSKVIVATDDERIYDHVRGFGAEVVMTKPDHPSGTDRCWEAYQKLMNDDLRFTIEYPENTHHSNYVINIQGDEPFISPDQIDELGQMLNGDIELATQMIPVDSSEILFDLGEVKIALNQHSEALYFSRQPIPFLKNVEPQHWHIQHQYYRHVGMYAYRMDILEKLTQLPPSALEKAESLEQLRWLEAGFKIKCITTYYDSHCIDTPEDIEKVLNQKNIKT